MNNKDRLIDDLSRHLADKLHQLLVDHVDTCERVEIEDQDAIAIALTSLMFEVLTAALALGLPKKQFMEMNSIAFDGMNSVLKKMERQQ